MEFFCGVKEQFWNAERPIFFMGVILQKILGYQKSHEIHQGIARRLHIWEVGQRTDLCTYTMEKIQSWIARAAHVLDYSEARTVNSRVQNSKLRAAMRGICGQVQGRVLYPNDADSNIG